MNKKKIFIFAFIILVIIISLCLLFGKKTTSTQTVEIQENYDIAQKKDIIKTITALGEVESAKIESLKLNTNYYFKTMCAEENEIIKAGSNILQYTNGKNMVAPYDCIITEYYVPKINEVCSDSNYVKISSIEDLNMKINISENELSKISAGQEVEITVNYDETKKYTGTISKINEIGTSGTNTTNFSSIVSLKNDGNLKLGMSATCTITIEKNENLLCVPIQSVSIENDERYVNLVKEDEIQKTAVTTGIADANYVQILSGLNENDKIYYQTETVSINDDDDESENKNIFGSLFGGKNDKSRGGMDHDN